MRIEDWQKIEELLDAALELQPAERGRFLEERAAGMPQLLSEVESLLACEKKLEGFLAAPALAFSADFFDDREMLDACAGQEIGRYRIIREIGRGGMGAVFLAERSDGEFQQQVALKVVRRSFADSELARRFLRERQILASLNHPNIARLLDGGVSAEGEPFFAMEYIEGVRIDDYCEAKNLPTDERLKIFLAVCRGIAYAHQNLVVHRDIKPSNILVTADGTPKLLDFGIAKLLAADMADENTQTAFRAFTPDYAAPEQMSGKPLTTASDVYSLGVLLQTILCGAHPSSIVRPAAGGWRSETPWRKTKETNLATEQATGNRKERAVGRRFISAELENIIAMARRDEPERRYASVTQFAEDIQRYLDGRPIRAERDSFTYRAGKFIRRNKLTVGAALLVSLSLVAGLAVALWQAGVARRERDRAERRFADVRQLSNALLTDIAPKIERLQGATEARQALVVQSLKYLDSLAQEAEGDLTLQAELAAAYENVGVLQGDSRKPSLSDFRGAIASLEKAQQIRRRLLEINPQDAQNRRLLAENLRLLAIRRMTQSDAEGGFRDEKEALQIYEKLVGEQPDSLELRRAFLETQVENGTNYVNLAKFAEAIPLLQQAAGQIEELRRAKPGDTETERILAGCLAYLGLALSWEVRQPEAEAEMARALAISESLAARFPNDTNLKQELWRVYISASSIFEEIDDARGFELCEKSRRVVEEIIAADPANAQARHNLSQSFSRLGISASNLGKPAEAIGYLERAMAIVLELQEKDPLNRGYDRDVSALYIRIGVTRYKQKEFPTALAAFQKGAASFEKQLANDPANTIALRDSAIAYRHTGITHKELAKTDNLQNRRVHLEAEKASYQKAVDALLKADAQNALPQVSRDLIEKFRKDIEELEKSP